MNKLMLLNAQEEYVNGIIIETERSRLLREAQNAQARLHNDNTLANRRAYGQSLKYYAQEINNKQMLDFAMRLINGEW